MISVLLNNGSLWRHINVLFTLTLNFCHFLALIAGILKQIVVRRRGHLTDNVFERYAKDVLSNIEFRWFWIAWVHGVLSYGRGQQVGLSVIGSYNASRKSAINYMSVSSYASNKGYWIIPRHYYHTAGTSFKLCLQRLLAKLT